MGKNRRLEACLDVGRFTSGHAVNALGRPLQITHSSSLGYALPGDCEIGDCKDGGSATGRRSIQ